MRRHLSRAGSFIWRLLISTTSPARARPPVIKRAPPAPRTHGARRWMHRHRTDIVGPFSPRRADGSGKPLDPRGFTSARNLWWLPRRELDGSLFRCQSCLNYEWNERLRNIGYHILCCLRNVESIFWTKLLLHRRYFDFWERWYLG